VRSRLPTALSLFLAVWTTYETDIAAFQRDREALFYWFDFRRKDLLAKWVSSFWFFERPTTDISLSLSAYLSRFSSSVTFRMRLFHLSHLLSRPQRSSFSSSWQNAGSFLHSIFQELFHLGITLLRNHEGATKENTERLKKRQKKEVDSLNFRHFPQRCDQSVDFSQSRHSPYLSSRLNLLHQQKVHSQPDPLRKELVKDQNLEPIFSNVRTVQLVDGNRVLSTFSAPQTRLQPETVP